MRASSAAFSRGKGTTVKKENNRKCYHSRGPGKLYIVGIGPGDISHMTVQAREVLKSCDTIVGYTTYIDLIKEIVRGKNVISTGMTQEVERCQKAIELATQGKKVAVVSSGDAGIYGMAGLVLELLHGSWVRGQGSEENNFIRITHHASRITVSIIPGVPAFSAAAALLGAPLMHDFASISLSDLLTDWRVIKKRIEMAAKGDFVIVLYNPKSKKREKQLDEAIGIVCKYRDKDTPVGIVRNAMRNGEEVRITTLGGLDSHRDFIDMFTILIIGNSNTFVYDGKMITPRGYDFSG